MWGIAKVGDRVETLRSLSELERVWAEPGSVVWLDFEGPTREDLERIDRVIDLDDEALEDCLSEDQRPRIDEYEGYFLLVAYGVIVPEGEDDVEPRKLAVFRGERFLITVHRQPSRSVAGLKQRGDKNALAMLSQGLDQMLYRMIDGMVDRYFLLLDDIEEDLEAYEERSFDPKANSGFLHDASVIRRRLIDVRRLAAAQHGLLGPLAEGEFDYVSEALSGSFARVQRHLQHALDRIAGLIDRLNATMHNYNSTLAKRTNEVVQTLTVLSAVVLPLSLVAGIYGMNVPIWPSGDDPVSFWKILAGMVALGAGMYAVFRAWRWV